MYSFESFFSSLNITKIDRSNSDEQYTECPRSIFSMITFVHWVIANMPWKFYDSMDIVVSYIYHKGQTPSHIYGRQSCLKTKFNTSILLEKVQTINATKNQ